MEEVVWLMVTGFGVVFAGAIVWGTSTMFATWNGQRNYEIRREKRRKHCQNGFDRLSENLSKTNDVDESICTLDVVSLSKRLHDGEISPIQALRAFQTKALTTHAKTNCLIEPIQEAEEWALAANKSGLLYGIPISLKDDVKLKGYNTSYGLTRLVQRTVKEDSAIVKVLKDQGAVPFVRTNIPQLEMSYEPGNPIYGTVCNPHSPKHIPGGSSSGEGALVGDGGSVLGIGSDIGGSLRSPAHFCGISTLKPTSYRMSAIGLSADFNEESAIHPVWGPLSRDVDGVVFLMKALWDGTMSKQDPLHPPLTFNNQIYESKEKLCIGYYINNGVFATTPACKRAVLMAVEKLKQLGHEVIPWMPPNIQRAEALELRVLFADGGDTFLDLLKYDKIDACIRWFKPVALPRWLKGIASFIISFFDRKRAAQIKYAMGVSKLEQYWEMEGDLLDYHTLVAKEWTHKGLDAVISPPLPFPAMPHDTTEASIAGGSYCMLYNVLDFPAGVVRMTKVTQADVDTMADYPEVDFEHRTVKQSASGWIGLPVGVQVAALRWKDELCLRIMKEMEQAMDY